ncbi:hypothetical protein [uncultured Alistipes sp.]|uniref:hypothetical protein n=1 Tax=uncultured Alistipes sp. TaxID=538949 RepID=UPI0025F99358|nr:hypothetical protein [uncultured Alistipes sp.]
MPLVTFILHDESVNTYGFRMLTSGANLEEFRKNPVMLLNHEDHELPIGRWESIRIDDERRILADALFDEADPRAQRVLSKVEGGFLRAASVGTWAPEELSDAEDLKLPGQTGPTVLRWTLREASIVTIGANHNALAMYDRSTGTRIDLEDRTAILRLMDTTIKTDTTMFKTLKSILHLQDATPDAEVMAAVKNMQAEKERLEAENKTLKDAAAQHDAERKQRQKTEAATLVDAAISEGRISAPGREDFLKFFDRDFEAAKSALAAIPRYESVARRVGRDDVAPELKDFNAKSWDELYREDRLEELRDKAPDLFRAKYKERFGVDYNG